jgi:hypothetical protein
MKMPQFRLTGFAPRQKRLVNSQTVSRGGREFSVFHDEEGSSERRGNVSSVTPCLPAQFRLTRFPPLEISADSSKKVLEI